MADFLASNEGVQLNRAFLRIRDPKLRRRVVDLVTAIAGEDEVAKLVGVALAEQPVAG